MTRNLLVRLLTGILLFPVALAALFYGGTAFTILIMIILLIATLEVNNLAAHKHVRFSTITSVIIVTVVGLMRPLFGGSIPFVWISAAFGLGLLFVLAYAAGERQHRLRDALVSVIGTTYLALGAYFSLYIRDLPAGFILWLLMFIGAFGMDTFSYIGGRLFGRHRLAPAISPGKTVEGAVIGGLCAIVIAVALLISTNTLIPVLIAVTIAMPFADLAGDLLESYVKRLYGAKDSNIPWLNVFPGHGGVFDRIDGMLMVVMITMLFLALAGL
ncbi:MAG: phosphatidate cytidylyltransferase [Anaerolineae bacterium]|nr:phosphatidate cytidylyltransferase [Anaerolineae bacterium]